MRSLILPVFVFAIVFLCRYLPAQDDTPGQEEREGQSSDDSAATEEARGFELLLVRQVREFLSTQNSERIGADKPQTESSSRATPPEPEPYDAGKLSDEIDEWESKSLSLIDGLKKQELGELAEKQEELEKKLREKVLGRERVVVNPQRRPGEGKDGERLEKLFREELGKLREKYEKEQRKIEREYEGEKKLVERTAEKLRESVKSGKQQRTDKPKGRGGHPPRGDKQTPDSQGPSKRGKK